MLITHLLLFIALAAAVWIAGAKLATYADQISGQSGISREVMGFVFLATATELPELVTNTTGSLMGEGALVVNSMFGGITMQTAVLVLADFACANHALTFLAQRAVNLLQGILLILLLACLLVIIALGDVPVLGHMGLGTLFMGSAYAMVLALLWQFQKDPQWTPLVIAEIDEEADDFNRDEDQALLTPPKLTLKDLAIRSLIASGVILICGIGLVSSAEILAEVSGLGTSFIGATLLASATSLPELSTAISAVRLGAHSMALADIFGSNMIMVFLLLPSDLFYREGLLLDAVDPSARFALVGGIVLTAIYLVGLLMNRPRQYARLGLDSWLVMVCYGLSVLVLYQLH